VDVVNWATAAEFFPWRHVQQSIESIEWNFRTIWVEFTQKDYPDARPCPKCASLATDLFWLSTSDLEPAWDAGSGRVGFLTLCERCRVQVDFLIDQELTDLQADQWRGCRTLS